MALKNLGEGRQVVYAGLMKAYHRAETASLGDQNKKNGLLMKKMLQKFGGFIESRYLCTRNSEMNYYLLLQ